MSDTNGAAKTKVTMTIEYDLLTGNMAIAGDAPNINISLSMLGQATREFEALERVNRVQQMQERAKQAAENQRIADMVTRRA